MTSRAISLASGVTRTVVLIGSYAIKMPSLRNGWALFLRGLLSNMTEREFTPLSEHFHLCPTVFSIPGGFLNIQRRCAPLDDEQWNAVAMDGSADWNGMDCDFKRDNFGSLEGCIVLLDFGEFIPSLTPPRRSANP